MINGVHTQKIYKLTKRIYKINYCLNPDKSWGAPFPPALILIEGKKKHLFLLTFEIPLITAPKISHRF